MIISLSYDYLLDKCVKVEPIHLATIAKLLVFLIPKWKDCTTGEHAGYVSDIYLNGLTSFFIIIHLFRIFRV